MTIGIDKYIMPAGDYGYVCSHCRYYYHHCCYLAHCRQVLGQPQPRPYRHLTATRPGTVAGSRSDLSQCACGMSSITAVEAITVITVSARLNGSVVVGGIANQRAGIQAF